MPPDFKAKMRKIRFPLEALPLTPVWEREGGILFTKANIQYQYHKTITSGRLPEGTTHQAGCL